MKFSEACIFKATYCAAYTTGSDNASHNTRDRVTALVTIALGLAINPVSMGASQGRVRLPAS